MGQGWSSSAFQHLKVKQRRRGQQEAEKIQSVRSMDLRERGVKEEDAKGSSKIRTET